jgi:PAS domain S-box-containing protein
MKSGKKTLLLTLLLLPVTITTLFGLLQRRQYRDNLVWLNIGFYIIMMVFSVCIALIIIREIATRNKIEAGLHSDIDFAAEEKLADVIISDAKEKIQQESEDSIRLLINNVKDFAIFMIDPNGNVASWNKGAENIKGYLAEEVIGHPIEIFYTNEDIIKNIPRRNLQLAKERGSYEDEGLRIRKDGSMFWASVIFSALWDEGGQLRGYMKVTRDISQRKQLEEDLHKQNIDLEAKIKERTDEIYYHERRFRALIENSYDIISLLDGSFKSIYRSPSATRITGWSDEDVLKINGQELIHPDDKQIVRDIFTESMTNPGKAIQVLFRGCHKNGNFIWLGGTMTNMLNDGHVNAVVFNVSDVTERIVSEEVLAASETRFRSLIENSAEGIALTDEFSNILYRSPASVKITGILPAENSISRTHPEDLLSIQTKIKESLSNPGVPVNFQGRFQHADRHYFWMEGTLTNMLHVKGIHAIVSNYRDITVKKEAEENLIQSEKLYRSLFENMLHGFAFCKGIFKDGQLVDFTYLAVNDEYELQTGLKNITGRNISEVMPGLLESDLEYIRIISRVALTGKPERFETYVELLDVWFAISLYSPDKEYFVALMDNITERKKAEHQVNSLNIELEKRVIRRTEQLKEKNDELEAFSYSVSHDLRAPLRSIIGFTTILEEEYSNKLDQEARRLTGVIKNNTQKMGNLIDDLLTFSRMGRHEMNKTTIDTNKIVEQVILELEQKSTRGQISWTIYPMQSMYGDINTMHQVWINLLSNAIKYSAGQAKPKIEISSFQNQDQMVFQVKDNGVGFDPKYTDKLFNVFQRLHGINEFEGTGVGLAIIEKVISRHGGKVWAEGEVDKGASFYFSLPVK